ncbi:hypothetical protein [Enterobacter phage 04_vB_Eclo_IJM]|nr:hypothetical protein [Enterobacter phage 04_vB_Eclo_IJM]
MVSAALKLARSLLMTSPLSKLNTLRRVSCPRHPTLSWLRLATPSVSSTPSSVVRKLLLSSTLLVWFATLVVLSSSTASCLTLRPTTESTRRP